MQRLNDIFLKQREFEDKELSKLTTMRQKFHKKLLAEDQQIDAHVLPGFTAELGEMKKNLEDENKKYLAGMGRYNLAISGVAMNEFLNKECHEKAPLPEDCDQLVRQSHQAYIEMQRIEDTMERNKSIPYVSYFEQSLWHKYNEAKRPEVTANLCDETKHSCYKKKP